MIKVYYHELIV